MASKDSKLILFRGFPHRGRHVVSPFVTKLEFRLRHAGIPFDVQGGSVSKAPLGKVPYVDIGPILERESNGPVLLGDSTLIIKRLVEMEHIPGLNDALSGPEKSHDLALRALLEDKLYFYQARERWVDNYHAQRDTVLASVPYPIRVVVGWIVYRKVNQTLYGQGAGRYTPQELETLICEMWQSINALLEPSMKGAAPNEPFWCLGGKQPTEADATLFGFLVSVFVSPSSPASRELVKTLPAIVEYAERIQNRWFPDYDKWE